MSEHFPVIHEQLEQEPASMLEHLGDTELTIFNITGTADELRQKCPHDFTPEQADRFLAKVAEQNGVAVPEKFQHYLVEKPKPEETQQSKPEIVAAVVAAKSKVEPKVTIEQPVIVDETPEVPEVSYPSAPQVRVPSEPEEVNSTDSPVASVEAAPEAVIVKKPKAPVIVQSVSLKIEKPTPVPTVETEVIDNPETETKKLQFEILPFAEGQIEQATESFDLQETSELTLPLQLDRIVVEAPAEGEVVVDAVPQDVRVEAVKVIEALPPVSPMIEAAPVIVELDEEVQAVILDIIETAPPEVSEPMQELMETIQAITERLELLVQTERHDSEEAMQIEAVLGEYFEQLYQLAGKQLEEPERRRIIFSIRARALVEAGEEAEEYIDESMRERLYDENAGSGSGSASLYEQTTKLARFIMHIGGLHLQLAS